MTLSEYDNLKLELSYIDAKISYDFSFLDSRWLERKMNNSYITYTRDNENLKNIYKYYDDMKKVIEKYIR